MTDLSAPPVPPERLARISFTCGTVRVPLQEGRPQGAHLTIQLIRATTSPKSTTRRRTVVLIPGGPGQSGVDNHAFLVGRMSDRLVSTFDVVGFDPRGVHHSGQLRCDHDESPPTLPDLLSDAGYARAAAEIRTVSDECLRSLGDRAARFGSTAAAGDLESIRVALGEEKLTFVGGSYGAKLGAEYARRFPSRIRAGVLDAPTDPETPWVTTVEHQVEGFERSLDEFVAWCRKQSCQGLRDVRGFIAALVTKADRSPIRSGRPAGDDPIVGRQVLDAVVSAMYDPVRWPDLAEGLVEADDGDSGTLWNLVDASGAGPDASDENDARFVINCTDSAPGPTEAEIRSAGAHFRDQFPTLGVWGSWQLFGCAFWTAPRHTLTPPAAPAAPPLVVLGTVHDPATPYAGAVSMAKVLGNGSSLVTWEGSGHTAYTRSPCIDSVVDDYLISLAVPTDGTRCAA